MKISINFNTMTGSEVVGTLEMERSGTNDLRMDLLDGTGKSLGWQKIKLEEFWQAACLLTGSGGRK